MRYCSNASCRRRPSFNVLHGKKGVFCMQHAEPGMVDVVNKRCTHESCRKVPMFNVEGRKGGVYCKQHAEDGMVNVRGRRCSYESCNKTPSFNIDGNNTPVYCKQHAADGMVDVVTLRCSHDSCIRRPSWGVLSKGGPTVCGHHRGDIFGQPLINFRAICKVAGCARVSKWGLGGKQPSHCRDHGPLENGLVCTLDVGAAGCKIPPSVHSHSYRVTTPPALNVKTECSF